MYERLLDNALESHADISHCGYQMVFPSRIDYYYNTKKRIIQDNETGIIDLLSGDFVEPSPCVKLYKKTIIIPEIVPDKNKRYENQYTCRRISV